jgi:hypothetical protein
MTMLDPHLDVDQLSAAVDGDRDAAISAHLLVCLSCREQVRTWQRSLGQLKDLAEATSPDSTDEMVEVAMTAWRPPASARRHRSVAAIAAAVAAVVLVGAGIYGLGRLAGTSGSASTSSAGAATGRPANSVPGAVAASGTSASAGGTGAGPRNPHGTSGSGGRATPASTNSGARLVVGDRARLAADLKREVRTKAVPAKVSAATPCLGAARSIATGSPLARTSSPSTGTPKPIFEQPVELGGTAGRVFLFGGKAGYVAFVLSDGSCSLVTSLRV